MASSNLVPQLLERNQDYTKTHKPAPYIPEFPPETVKPSLVVFSCCDGRVNPEALLGLKPGEAIVIRNAGCDVPRNLPDLLILDQVLGIREVLILQHTDCGVTYTTDDSIRLSLEKMAPSQTEQIAALRFSTFKNDLPSTERRAREMAEFVRTSPFVRKELGENTIGAVYDIKTGNVTRVY